MKYTKTDRASEDHININGEVHKLDQTIFEFKVNPERPNATSEEELDIYMSTYEGERQVFPSNKCKVVFTPEKTFTEGLNLALIAHRRYWKIGTYDINCRIDGKEIVLPKARGFFEHIWSRH